MPIANDWSIDYNNKIISHIDGTLVTDAGVGTIPGVGDVVRGVTSGAIGKILTISGTVDALTFQLTDVVGVFADNEVLVNCDKIDFDLVEFGGFKVGDTITGVTSTRSGVVRKIDYSGTSGSAWSEDFGVGAWTDNEKIQVSAQDRASASGTGEDNNTTYTTSAIAGYLVPETKTIITNYDAGTVAFPRFCKVQDSGDTKSGYLESVTGVVATGSLRLNDYAGVDFTDGEALYIGNVVYHGIMQTGKVFAENTWVRGATSGAKGKIIGIIDDGDDTGKIILMSQTGTFTTTENLEVLQSDKTWVQYSVREDVAGTISAATVNQFSAASILIKTQLPSQGGLFDVGAGLMPVRSANAFFTMVMEDFDELGQLDDQIPMEAKVRLGLYNIMNGWKVPDLSFRFLESGAIQEVDLNNIWTCYQTIGTIAGIGDTAFDVDTPQPQMYIEQNGSVIDPWWYYGSLDVLVKVKSNTDPSTDDTLGSLIGGGTVTIFCRRYGDTYSHTEVTTVGAVAPVALGSQVDTANTTGTHSFTFNTGVGTFTVGEEFIDGTDASKRGVVVTRDAGATGTITYINVGTTVFINTDSITGQRSGATANINSVITNVVAGYGNDLVLAICDGYCDYATKTGTFYIGESVTQAVTGATGIVLWDDSATNLRMYFGNESSTVFSGDNVITGDQSGATLDTFVGAVSTLVSAETFNYDIGDGNGDQPYNAAMCLNPTDASAQTLAKAYEWQKYLVARFGTTTINGPGQVDSGVEGRIFRRLKSTYPEEWVGAPMGTYPGGAILFGATGWAIIGMASSDVQNVKLRDANDVLRTPPNLQTLTVSNLEAGVRVAAFRRPNSTPGSGIYTTEYTLAAGNNSGNGTIVVNEALNTDIPDSGNIRIWNDVTLIFDSYAYTSYDSGTKTFALSGTLSQNYTSGDNAFVPLVEEQASATSISKTFVYSADIPIQFDVRLKGWKPFVGEGTFVGTGVVLTPVRDLDDIVD